MSAGRAHRLSRYYPHSESAYPLLALALLMTVYFVVGRVFGTCDLWGAGCNALDIRPLLDAVVPPDRRPLVVPGSRGVLQEALPGRGLWTLVVGVNAIVCFVGVLAAFHLIRASVEKRARPLSLTFLLLGIFLLVSVFAGRLAAPTGEPPRDEFARDSRPILFQALEATAQRDVQKVIPAVAEL